MDPFKGWAILELMGHRRLAGFVQEVTLAGAGMLRIDVPSKDGDATQFFQPASIYAMTPCSEATARAVAGAGMPAPVNEWELPSLRGKALPAGRVDYDDEVGDFNEHDDQEQGPTLDDLPELVREYSLGSVLARLEDDHYNDGHARLHAILGHARALVNADEWPRSLAASPGVAAIDAARNAQLEQGYDAAHDDAHEASGQLAAAAAWLIYMAGQGLDYAVTNSPQWATDFINKHSGERETLLAHAGALVAAEIDRLKRAEAKAPPIEAQAADLASAHPSGVDVPATPAPSPEPVAISDEVQF